MGGQKQYKTHSTLLRHSIVSIMDSPGFEVVESKETRIFRFVESADLTDDEQNIHFLELVRGEFREAQVSVPRIFLLSGGTHRHLHRTG